MPLGMGNSSPYNKRYRNLDEGLIEFAKDLEISHKEVLYQRSYSPRSISKSKSKMYIFHLYSNI